MSTPGGAMRTPCPFGAMKCFNAEGRDGLPVGPKTNEALCRACSVVTGLQEQIDRLYDELRRGGNG